MNDPIPVGTAVLIRSSGEAPPLHGTIASVKLLSDGTVYTYRVDLPGGEVFICPPEMVSPA